MGASLLAVAKSIYYWSKKERARGNVTQYFINKQAYEIFFHRGKQNTSDLHPSIRNNARCSQDSHRIDLEHVNSLSNF